MNILFSLNGRKIKSPLLEHRVKQAMVDAALAGCIRLLSDVRGPSGDRPRITIDFEDGIRVGINGSDAVIREVDRLLQTEG